MKEYFKAVTDFVINYFESEHIMMQNSTAEALVEKWYRLAPRADFLSLAALAIENPTKIALSDKEIREIRNFYFN